MGNIQTDVDGGHQSRQISIDFGWFSHIHFSLGKNSNKIASQSIGGIFSLGWESKMEICVGVKPR